MNGRVPPTENRQASGTRATLRCLLVLGWCAAATRSAGAERPDSPLVLREHYAHSIAALGYPGARRAFQIGHGSQASSGEAAVTWRLVSAPGAVFTSPVYFERDGVPIAHWWMVSARESVHFEAAAAPNTALGDSSLELSVLATTVWRGAEPGESVLQIQIRAEPEGPHVVPWDAPRAVHPAVWKDGIAFRDDKVVAVLRGGESSSDPSGARRPAATRDAAALRGVAPGARTAVWRARLRPGESHRCEVWMPLYPLVEAALVSRGRTHAQVAAAARRGWREWIANAATLVTPDAQINAAWRAALVTLIQCQEREDGHWVPIGSPFQYRDVWLRDGARMVRALAVAGLTEWARDDAWSLTRFSLPSGALLSQRGQLDGTGQGLWAFEQACALPPDRDAARHFLPPALRALSWIEGQRRTTRDLGLTWPGLLPYADPRDGELVRAQLVGNDAWSYAGCRAVAVLARLAGDGAAERRAFAAANDGRDAFEQALGRTRHPDVPPSWQGEGNDWGNAAVGYPTGVLPPDAPRLAALAKRIWTAAGNTGLASYGRPDLLHGYLGSDLAQNALLAGRPAEARDYVRALLAHSSSTLGQAETFERTSGGFGANLPPHGTAAATLVDLLRNMIVCDWRDSLELGMGGGLAWWSGTRLERAPTRFGRVTIRLERPASNRLHASWTPVATLTRVRIPDGARAVAALTPGTRRVTERWIECLPGTSEASIVIVLEGTRGTP